MYQELTALAEDFAQYRGKRKRTKYPTSLWDKAVQLCKHHTVKKIADSLQVSMNSLHRHIRSRKNNANTPSPFVPIEITPQSSIQLHVGGPLPMTIEFDRPMEEVAKFVIAIQGGLQC